MANTVNDEPIQVVAGILSDAHGRVLVAERERGTHLAGTWEFPGGKVEPGETAGAALRRELHEELGVVVGSIEPLISVPWRYPGKAIVLHAFRVHDFRGIPQGRQQQSIRWLSPDEAARVPMPPPDLPIVTALRLPTVYAITPDPADDPTAFLHRFERLLRTGVTFIQLRAKRLPMKDLRTVASRAGDLSRAAGATLLLNGNAELVRELALDGIHLPATDLLALDRRPLGRDRWVAASCHDEHELAHAAAIGVDFAVLGPVQPTASHPGATALGWSRLADLNAIAQFPVYALGGLKASHVSHARRFGLQGVAGVSAFWPVG